MTSLGEWLDRPRNVADRLRMLRAEAGYSGHRLAEITGWAQSKVSRIETGKQTPTNEDITVWVSACGGSAETTARLLKLQADARVNAVAFSQSMADGQVPQQTDYDQLFEEAIRVRDFETVYVPGLLQIPEYTRRVRREMVPLHDLHVDDSDAAVGNRMRQQQNLYDPSKRFEFVIGEPVLRYMLVAPNVMRGQLDRLQTLMGLDRVRFGIIPLGVELHWTPQHSFQIYDLPDGPVVEVESVVKGLWHRGEDAERFGRFFEWLWDDAVEGPRAQDLISAVIRDLPRD